MMFVSTFPLTIFCKNVSFSSGLNGTYIVLTILTLSEEIREGLPNCLLLWITDQGDQWPVMYAYLFRGDTDTDNGVITDDHTLLIISDRPTVSSNTGGAFQPSTQLITLRPEQLTWGRKHQQAMSLHAHGHWTCPCSVYIQ